MACISPRIPGRLGITSALMRPDGSAKFWLIQRIRTPFWSVRSGVPRDRNKNEASTARLTGDSIGNAYSLRTKTRVAPVWPWTRTIRAYCLQACGNWRCTPGERSEEHTSELQSLAYLVCRLLLEKKKNNDAYKPQCRLE